GLLVDGKPRFGIVEQLVLLAVLGMALVMPWIVAAAKRYQHNGYRIAAQQGELRLGAGSMYWLCLKGAGIGLLVIVAGTVLVMLLSGMSIFLGKSQAALMVSTFISVGLIYLLMFTLVRPFAAVHTARMRLEALCLTMAGAPETWVTGQESASQDAAGDLAGDFFGI